MKTRAAVAVGAGKPLEINSRAYRSPASEAKGDTIINPSVFQGPTGTKSTSEESNGQAGRPESMPHAINKLQLRSRAAAWMPRNT